VIRVVRSAEPPALTSARTRHLAKAAAAYDAHGAPSTELSNCLGGYNGNDDIKAALHRAQRKKCAWCERVRDFSSSPVEHYRPKDGAWRHLPGHKPTKSDPGHYWWLTWTWENLLFSCARCNDRGHKANYFPLEPGSSACLPPPRPVGASFPSTCYDLSSERPMLLDPTTDSFLEHVRWVPFNTRFPRRRWTWSPKPVTPRGQVTIKILKLAELADDVGMHLANSVLPPLEEVEQHLEDGRIRQATRCWDALIKILNPENPLTAATWCALERWMPQRQRALHGLAHPARPV
jgi:hypothetical protein